MASTFVSDHYGGPTLLFALLIGMAFHFLSREGSCPPGVAFCSTTVLRLGVGLVGARISLQAILDLGWSPILVVVTAVITTIAFGVLAARLFRLDLTTGEVKACRTAHGRGSDPAHTGFAQRFSNVPDSNASSVGAYLTVGQSWGSKHGPNVLLDGLDPTNSEVRDRAIIVHAADYCEPAYLASQGKLGRSFGCFALSQADLNALRPDMGGGRLLFAGV
jgi:hypothetical protein